MYQLAKSPSWESRDDAAESIAEVLDRLKSRIGCRHASVVFLHPDTDVIDDAFGADIFDDVWEAFGPGVGGSSPLFQAIETGKPMRVDNTASDAQLSERRRRLCQEMNVHSFWLVPLPPHRAALLMTEVPGDGAVEPLEVVPFAVEVARLIGDLQSGKRADDDEDYDPTRAYWRNVMLDAVTDPVIVSDVENNVIEMNKQAAELLQVDPGAPEGKLMAVELNNFLLTAALSSFALDRGAALARDFTLVDPVEGTDLLFEVISSWQDNPDGNERSLVSVLRNVTDLSEATTQMNEHLQQLHDSNLTLSWERDRVNLLLENLRDPVVVADPSGAILRVNPAGERLLTVPPGGGGVPGAHFANEARLNAFLLDLEIGPEATRTGELAFRDPESGEELSMAAAASKVRDKMGQVVALVCVLHDLTEVKELERRRLEERLFESEKLAALGRLAAAVAHEINNPLEAVKNAVYLLNQTSTPPERREDYFGIVTRETERISRIIHQMLGLYRPQMNRDLVDVSVVLNDAVTLIRPNLNNHRTQVEVPPAGSVPRVMASADQLRQVFLNLLLNGADAAGENGDIRVTTTVQQKSPDGRPGPFVAIAVQDNGDGIDPKHLPNLFDPFFSTKREKMGAGLGLWISKDIITQHGGEIHADSKVGQGTTFTVLLPVGERS